jgi:putative ABC transport system permease protein
MKLFRRSIRNVLRNPLRLILVVVLLSTSLMFVAAMTSLSTYAQQELAAVHQQLGTTITIRDVANETTQVTGQQGMGGLTTPKPTPNSIVQKVEHTPGVARTEESLSRPDPDGTLIGTTASGPGGQIPNITVGIYAFPKGTSHFTLSNGIVPAFVAGRGFRDSDANAYVAMMSQALARVNHLQLGSTFTLKGKTFTIIGLYTTTDQFSASSFIIPLATMQQVLGINGVDAITAYATSYEQVETVATRLRHALGQQYDVVTQGSQYDGVFSAVSAAQNTIQLALIVSIGIAVVVLIFAVLMLVRERTAEIAILKTIGASHVQVLRQFWTEIVTLSATAALLAALLLATLGPVISQRFTISPPPVTTGTFMHVGNGTSITETPLNPNVHDIHLAAASLNAQTFLIILGLGLGLALLTSLIPTWFVAHLKPVEVLRKAN